MRAYKCDLQTGPQVARPLDLVLGPVQPIEYLAAVRRQRGQHLGPFAADAHQPDGRLRVARCDGLEDDAGRVGLGLKSCGLVVSVPAALAVVHQDHDRFERHVCDYVVGYRFAESAFVERLLLRVLC